MRMSRIKEGHREPMCQLKSSKICLIMGSMHSIILVPQYTETKTLLYIYIYVVAFWEIKIQERYGLPYKYGI